MRRQLNRRRRIAESEVTGSAGGGMVEVVLKGNKTPFQSNQTEAVDPDDVEMLEPCAYGVKRRNAQAKRCKDLLGPLAGNGLF